MRWAFRSLESPCHARGMKITPKGKYSVRAVLDIAQHSNGSPVSAQFPNEKAFHSFRNNFSRSSARGTCKERRGSHGGYGLAETPQRSHWTHSRLIEPPLYSTVFQERNC